MNAERPASQLTYNKWMAEHLLFIEQGPKALTPAPEMLNPHRRVNQDHAGRLRRRLRIGRKAFSAPPSSANRRPLSLACQDRPAK